MPDFYRLLDDQCDLVVRALEVFVEFMETGEPGNARKVRALEHEGDEIKARNIDVLNRSFSTPFDREDIYRAVSSIDEILNYAKTTVREMEILVVEPDEHTLAMAKLLYEGSEHLRQGFGNLKDNPAGAEKDADAVRKTERRTEKVYRRAIAELLDPEHYLHTLAAEWQDPVHQKLTLLLEPMDKQGCASVTRALSFIIVALKKREVYRHLSNASDHLAHAGDILHDIVVKVA